LGYWALIISSILYAVVTIDFAIKKEYPLALIFFCYTLANIGYIWLGYFNKGVQ